MAEERRGSYLATQGQQEIEISFSPPLPDSDYEVAFSVFSDSTSSETVEMFLEAVKNKTPSSFVVVLSGPVPSTGFYYIDWIAVKSG